MQFEKIQNNGPKVPELVMDSLLKAMEAGTIRVGEELPPERDLAEALGISRNSLRECLAIMSFMGIVENRGNRKILVKNADRFRKARSLIGLSYFSGHVRGLHGIPPDQRERNRQTGLHPGNGRGLGTTSQFGGTAGSGCDGL